MKIGIITDSASNLDLAFINKHENLPKIDLYFGCRRSF